MDRHGTLVHTFEFPFCFFEVFFFDRISTLETFIMKLLPPKIIPVDLKGASAKSTFLNLDGFPS